MGDTGTQESWSDTFGSCLDAYRREWRRRYGDGTVELTRADRAELARLIKERGASETVTLLAAYLADDDPYVTERGHPIALITTRITRYVAKRGRGKTASAGVRQGAVGSCQVCDLPVAYDEEAGYVHAMCATDEYAFRCRPCGKPIRAADQVVGLPMEHVGCWEPTQQRGT